MTSKGVWDPAADRKLLLGILKTHKITVDNEAMAKYMSTEGYTFTQSAIQNRMKKLKKMANDETEVENAADPKASGRKRGPASSVDGETPTKKRKTGKGKGGRAKSSSEDVDGDDEEANVKVKPEEGSEDELA